MYAKYDLFNGLKHQKQNKTKLIQTKPNKTSFSLYAKFSPNSYLLELKFGMYAKLDLPNGPKWNTTKMEENMRELCHSLAWTLNGA